MSTPYFKISVKRMQAGIIDREATHAGVDLEGSVLIFSLPSRVIVLSMMCEPSS